LANKLLIKIKDVIMSGQLSFFGIIESIILIANAMAIINEE